MFWFPLHGWKHTQQTFICICMSRLSEGIPLICKMSTLKGLKQRECLSVSTWIIPQEDVHVNLSLKGDKTSADVEWRQHACSYSLVFTSWVCVLPSVQTVRLTGCMHVFFYANATFSQFLNACLTKKHASIIFGKHLYLINFTLFWIEFVFTLP